MTTTQSIELLVAINLFVIGLSHLLQANIWVDFFKYLHAKKNIGNILNALMSLAFGSLIVAFHFVWEWPKIVITVYGMLQVLKGFVYLLFPSVGIASMGRVNLENEQKFKWVGAVMVLLSMLLGYGLFVELG